MPRIAIPCLRPLYCLIIAFAITISVIDCMAENQGAAYFDFGVFAFEDGDYEAAEKNFQHAVKADPRNPDYLHYLGRTYLKTNRLKEAENALNQAVQYNATMEGLTYDRAIVQYRLGVYPVASFLFAEELSANPSNALAQYYLAICMYKRQQYKNALAHFEKASHKSPSIKPNGFFYAGICHMQLQQTEKAIEKFAWVTENASHRDLKTNAEKWLQTARAIGRGENPLHLFCKIGTQYDDNVALEPIDQDIFADEGSLGITAYFSGKYRLLRFRGLSAGIGYNHYQSFHFDLSEYNLMGSIPNLYLKYSSQSWALTVSLLPTYYWLDDEKYMLRRQANTELIWNISERLASRYAFLFFDETNYITSGKNGQNIQFLMDLFYRIPENKITLLGEAGYDQSDTDHTDYQYMGLQAKVGLAMELPGELIFSPSGRIYGKQYDQPHTTYSQKRDDVKYELSASLSRHMWYRWLTGSMEYKYTKNDSNISVYSYQSNRIAFAVSASY